MVERAGIRAAHGKDPYQVVDRNGHILIRQTAIPVYELYYPYLPGMVRVRLLQRAARWRPA